ncbi:flagellar biosynthesis protein FlhF [Paracraurococcus lichenis]|uniref:GTPase n=1 Tax=Paracraurococcus lichenis TaxID=3064888 RepID=A0ABT9E1X9_9PROT|nr:GTPase [Paracraurococcus sp. LOR1-02]MDO9710025.1 GTPase [Paracraurococcus sp. LOR1-02]
MRLRLFRAPRMAEAMAQVRAELGEEAVILETRRVAGGVEVTAALEDPPDPAEEPWLIPPAPPATDAAPSQPAPSLARHNLPPALAAALAAGPLEPALAAALGFAPLPDAAARPLLLAGPPGAGKTLSCAKLAARAVLAGGAPLIVTTDGARAGAAEQMAAFTRVLGLTLAVAPQPKALGRALARRAAGQAVLIDTAGCDPFDPAQAADLLALARTAEAAVVLVLPAGLDPAEAAETARAFRALGARHLLPTRLDAARRLGGVLAAAAAGLALTEAGVGPDPAGDLAPVDPAWLAARLRRAPEAGFDAAGPPGHEGRVA